MKKTNIYYIHGFNSGTKLERLELLTNLLDTKVKGLAYDSGASFDENIEALETVIDPDARNIFIGTSLGAYYAQYLAEKYSDMSVLINPSLHPQDTLKKYFGTNVNYTTSETYELTSEIVDSYTFTPEFYTNTLCILASGDEVLDSFQTEKELENLCEVIMVNGGEHSFNQYEEVAEDIINFISTPTLDN